jgi:hypothetical protein
MMGVFLSAANNTPIRNCKIFRCGLFKKVNGYKKANDTWY